ncbi:MAG: CPBP family glutamic-type intramembrane protease [Acutalibacteraceae bacterium]|nr:CPBP family glutamic-type intramembrane protease [Acutalibacteraceae bacterium]
MNKLKKPFLFTIALLPVAILGGLFTCLYQFDLYSDEVVEQTIAQIGSKEMLILVYVIQICAYTFVCGLIGYILAEKTGLMRSFKIEKSALVKVLLITAVMGVIFSLDYWTFGSVEPAIQEGTKAGLTVNAVIASVLYGGVIEEVMLRLMVMSLFSFIIWKIFCRNKPKEKIPEIVFLTANIVAALLFAIGHIPATINAFGELTPLIVFRCLLLNGGLGFVFGLIYRKYGIQYSMIGHMGVHIISKLIWLIFI